MHEQCLAYRWFMNINMEWIDYKKLCLHDFFIGSYFQLACKDYDCKSCEEEYPSCEGKEDGLYPLPGRPYDIIYIKCDKGRRIGRGLCPRDPEWGVQTFPYNRQCVHMFAVPKDDHIHGQLPSCNGKFDGNYPYLTRDTGYCHGHYKCEGGMATAVKCPNETLYDTVKGACKIGGVCVI